MIVISEGRKLKHISEGEEVTSPGWPSRQEVDGGAGTEPRLVRAESAQLPEPLLFTPFNIRTIQRAGAGDWEAFSSPSLLSASLLLPHLRSWHRIASALTVTARPGSSQPSFRAHPPAGRVQFSLAPRRNPQPSRRLLCPSQPSPPRAHIRAAAAATSMFLLLPLGPSQFILSGTEARKIFQR